MKQLTIEDLLTQYREGVTTPREVVQKALAQIDEQRDFNAWITVLSTEQLEPWLKNLEQQSMDELPLYGVPFAIKDNIDLANVPTSAACPEFTYVPKESAFVVQCLLDAGAIPLGKTNLDQFATGLVGTRSPQPYGICKNATHEDYISGGSSSGSAVALALGQVCFALGTDTAGSGRVPAAFNNLVGYKPGKGLLSTRGVVPACRSLDCVSVFTHSAVDANIVMDVAAVEDKEDTYSCAFHFANRNQRFGAVTDALVIGVPEDVETFGDDETLVLFEGAQRRFEALGHRIEKIDFSPFVAAAKLLYEGPWVTERFLAVETLLKANPGALLPVTREIIRQGDPEYNPSASAAALFSAQYQLQAYKKQCDELLTQVDCIVTPTTPSHYTIDEVNNDPVTLNSRLGYYTNFMNLLDYSAVAVPAGFRADGRPFGVTIFGAALSDKFLLSIAGQFNGEGPSGDVADGSIAVVVCGAHLQGLPLHWQLAQRHASLVEKTTTAPSYRFYALSGGPPWRPGLIRDEQAGAAIEVEVWKMPAEEFGSFVAGIPQPLGIGKVELANGRWENSFICEPCGIEGAEEITHIGSWRQYMKNKI